MVINDGKETLGKILCDNVKGTKKVITFLSQKGLIDQIVISFFFSVTYIFSKSDGCSVSLLEISVIWGRYSILYNVMLNEFSSYFAKLYSIALMWRYVRIVVRYCTRISDKMDLLKKLTV